MRSSEGKSIQMFGFLVQLTLADGLLWCSQCCKQILEEMLALLGTDALMSSNFCHIPNLKYVFYIITGFKSVT